MKNAGMLGSTVPEGLAMMMSGSKVLSYTRTAVAPAASALLTCTQPTVVLCDTRFHCGSCSSEGHALIHDGRGKMSRCVSMQPDLYLMYLQTISASRHFVQ